MADVAGNGNISGMNNADNVMVDKKKMTLDDARYELHKRGFTINEYSLYNNRSHSFVGVKSTWYFDLTKFDVMVFVHEIQPFMESGDRAEGGYCSRSSGELTIQRIENDMEELQSHLIVDYDPGGFPPHGVQRGRMILLIYLTPYAIKRIDPVVLRKICATPAKECCTVTFLAVQDGFDKQAYFMPERDTPYFGKIHFPEIFYYTDVVTGKPNMPDTPPSLPLWYKTGFLLYYTTFLLASLLAQNLVFSIIIFIIACIVMSIIITIYHCYRKRSGSGNNRLLPPRTNSKTGANRNGSYEHRS